MLNLAQNSWFYRSYTLYTVHFLAGINFGGFGPTAKFRQSLSPAKVSTFTVTAASFHTSRDRLDLASIGYRLIIYPQTRNRVTLTPTIQNRVPKPPV